MEHQVEPYLLELVGSAVNTQVRGNLTVPYGNVFTNDILCGGSNTSLITALNTKLNWTNPLYNGTLQNTDASLQIGASGNVNCGVLTCGNVTCPDVKYNSGANSLITSLSNINTTLTSQLTTLNKHTSSINSIKTTISTLAPISGNSTIYATFFRALTNVACDSIQTNGRASVIGDVLYGLGKHPYQH